jgi:phosphatidylglycerophosphate synthase
LLDGAARRVIGPVIDHAGCKLAGWGIPADAVTIAGFVLGLAAAAAIVPGFYIPALVLLLLSRVCDGLDGAVARYTAKTDRGGFLDIVLDFAFYAAIPLAFVLADPAANAVAGAVLLASFYVNGASFLAFATIAAKRGLTTEARGEKSLYFTVGLAEATETIAVFCLFCLFPGAFPETAWLFAAVCLITAAARVILAVRLFGES